MERKELPYKTGNRFSIGEYILYKSGDETTISQVEDFPNGYTLITNMGKLDLNDTSILIRAYTLEELQSKIRRLESKLGKSILSSY